MKRRTTLLDLIENLWDRLRYHLESWYDTVSENCSDAYWWCVEGLAQDVGTTTVKYLNKLIPTPEKKDGRLVRVSRLILGVGLFVAIFLLFQIAISLIALAANLFGARRGREYTWLENAVSWLPVFVLAIAMPYLTTKETLIGNMTILLAYAIAVQGLNIIVGMIGEISLGHGAFTLMGGFVTTLLLLQPIFGVQIPLIVAVFAGGAAMAVLGMLVSLPAIRVKGPYLSLLTLGLMMCVAPVLESRAFAPYTHGVEGISFSSPKPPEFLAFIKPSIWLYYHTLFFFILLFYSAHIVLRRTKVGRALVSVRSNDEKSAVLGINVANTKMIGFGLSAFYGGIAGGLLSQQVGFIGTQATTLNDSLNFLVALVIGGRGLLLGSFLGGAFMTYQVPIASWLSSWIKHGDYLLWGVFGLIAVVMMIFAPRGIVGEISHWLRARTISLPLRRRHRRNPFPDYEIEEEFTAAGTILDAKGTIDLFNESPSRAPELGPGPGPL